MSGRPTFLSQLSSIMETVTRSVLSQVCELVDEDSRELRMELSRLLVANSTLADRVNSLECELTTAWRNGPTSGKSNRSVGVQTVGCRDEDAHVSEQPTIAGIFGKDWCMSLWKDGDPSSLHKLTPQSAEESVATLSDHYDVAEMKAKVYLEDYGSRCQQATLGAKEYKESLTEEQEQPSMSYQAGNSTFSSSYDQDEGRGLSAGGTEEPSVQPISINDTEEAFNIYVIPIEEDDDDDDVQFVQESQPEPVMNDARGFGHDEQQTLPSDVPRSGAALIKASRKTARVPNMEKFTCKVCSRTFYHRGTLTRHMKSHKSTFCSICKQHFPRRKKLVSHTCVPPVPARNVSRSCELCGKTFSNKSALRMHNVVHTGEKPYRCSVCGKRFTQKGNLKCHLRLHTGEKRFRCVRCGKTFTQKVNLTHHLMAEHPQP